MGRGQGYFWSGLAQGLGNLYNQNMNERMAREARAFSAEQSGLERGERARQFDRMFPHKSKEDDLTIPLQKTTQEELTDAERALADAKMSLVNNFNEKATPALQADIIRAKARYDRAVAAHSTAQKGSFEKQNLPAPGIPAPAKSEKQKDLEAIRAILNRGKK